MTDATTAVTIVEARDAARDLIRPYVERGDTQEQLRRGSMGAYTSEYAVSVGSFGFARCRARYGADSITVSEVAERPCCYCFRLSELYEELRTGMRQIGLGI